MYHNVLSFTAKKEEERREEEKKEKKKEKKQMNKKHVDDGILYFKFNQNLAKHFLCFCLCHYHFENGGL